METCMTIAIRTAVAGDLPDITAIYAEAVTHGTASYELAAPTLEEMRSRFSTLTSAGYPYLAAEEAGRLIGYAYAGPFRPRPAYRFMVEDSIYLAPGARGKGIGLLLLSRLVEDCTRLGFRQIAAAIGDGETNHASVRLHEKAGFRHVGTLQGSGFKHGRWLDTVFMQLELNGGKALPPDPGSLPGRMLA